MFHLLRHELRRHSVLYPLAALLIFCTQIAFNSVFKHGPGPANTWASLTLVAVGAVTIHLMMRSHPWNDDRAFWRTRPIPPLQLLGSQMIAVILVVLVPLAAALVLKVLPLHLGLPATPLAILLPLAAGLAIAAALATCAALTPCGKLNTIPYLLAFLAPILSSTVFGFFRLVMLDTQSGPKTDGEFISNFICASAATTLGTLAALCFGTLARKRAASMAVLLVTGISLPWLLGIVAFDFFQYPSQPPRKLTALIKPSTEGTDSTRPAWNGLNPGEFFAPAVIRADWANDGKHATWSWTQKTHRADILFQPTLLGQGHRRALNDQHNQFATACDVPTLWANIRTQLPEHSAWRLQEETLRSRYPIKLPGNTPENKLALEADGNIFRFEARSPVHPIVTGPVAATGPGRLEIRRIENDDSRVGFLIRDQTPNPTFNSEYAAPANFTTSPPEIWAVLHHAPSSTAYACHGLRTRLDHFGGTGMIIHTRHYILVFQLPKLETRLLGLDPRQVLAESSLHLFQPRLVERATATLAP